MIILSQLPTPTNLGDKLWEHSPLTYLLVAGVVVLGLVVAFMFKKYDEQVRERRKDDMQTLEVLKGLSTILDSLQKSADRHVQDVRADIAATQGIVKEQIDGLKAYWK